MSRKKKVKEKFKNKVKKAKTKLHASNKPRYISKAERERLALENPNGEAGNEAMNQQSLTLTDKSLPPTDKNPAQTGESSAQTDD